MIKQAIIIAGGFGTRLQSVIKDLPKPMADINGKPFLEYLLNFLKKQGIKKVILSVGYKYKMIVDYFGENFSGINIVYSIEEEPLGTGGAIKKALNYIDYNDVFVLNGDTFFDINLSEFYKFHIGKKSDLSIGLKIMRNSDRYGIVEVDDDFKIKNFIEKRYSDKALINAGVYILKKDFLLTLNPPDKFSFEKDFLERYYRTYAFYGFPSDASFIDIGIPSDYYFAHSLFNPNQK